MQNENYPQLNLDIAHVIEHANTLDEEPEKLRYLSQYSRLFAVYAEYEPFQVDALLNVLPENFQEEVWKLYNQELFVQFEKDQIQAHGRQEIVVDTVSLSKNDQRDKPNVTRKSTAGLHQMKRLIDKVDIEMEKRFGESQLQRKVWYELRENYIKYDDEEIIDVAEPELIKWYTYTGRQEIMKYTTFKKNLSIVRRERGNPKT